MTKNWLWDRRITQTTLKKILSNPDHPKFVNLAALILSRENTPKKVFEYISREDFYKNWQRIKRQMRKDNWSEPRIIFWQAVYEKVIEKFGNKGFTKNKTNIVIDEICNNIGKQIRGLRLKKSLTQSKLALKFGISQQMLSRIESGKENLSLLTLKDIVKKLGAKLNIEIKLD